MAHNNKEIVNQHLSVNQKPVLVLEDTGYKTLIKMPFVVWTGVLQTRAKVSIDSSCKEDINWKILHLFTKLMLGFFNLAHLFLLGTQTFVGLLYILVAKNMKKCPAKVLSRLL